MQLVVPTHDISMTPSIMNGDYEAVELDIFEKLVKPGMVVLDIGANLGIYTITASKLVGSRGHVYAFEPVQENIRYLTENVALNAADANVTIVPQAVGDKAGTAEMGIAKNTGTHAIGAAAEFGTSTMVKVTTIDRFMRGKKIDIVKMDVEGYEGHVLRGGLKALPGTTMIMEFQAEMLRRAGSDPDKVGKQLRKMKSRQRSGQSG
jgi:FkbM family methyltransferase